MNRLRLQTILAIALPLVFIYVFTLNWQVFYSFLVQLVKLLSPLLIGFSIAFLIVPVHELILKSLRKTQINKSIAEVISLAITMALVVIILLAIALMIIPQLITSVQNLSSSLPSFIMNIEVWALQKFDASAQEQIMKMIQSMTAYLAENSQEIIEWFNVRLVSFSTLIIGGFWQVVLITISVLVFLKDRQYLNRMTKQTTTVLIGEYYAQVLSEFMAMLSKMSRRYFTAQAFDSLIVGVLFYLAMIMLKIEYPLLLAVVNLLTNMIPFFGPFIGAIPSAFILLTIDPTMALKFLGITLVVQQIDANVLNPIIHGDSLGIPPLGISLAVLFFGYLFGFFGMIIALPLFGVLYQYLKQWVEYRLSLNRLKEDEV